METSETTGAQALVAALAVAGVDVFFMNPGTSEIHLVSAIDAHPTARPVLCLFEGVATGAADGYARATGRPAAAVLHLGPGLANGLANLHNARKARSPMVVVVGEHALAHLQHETPLRSDLQLLSHYAAKRAFRLDHPAQVAAVVQEAVRLACDAPAGPVVLVAPADTMWGASATSPVQQGAMPSGDDGVAAVDGALVGAMTTALRNGSACALVLGGAALTARGTMLADRIAQATGCALYCETFNAAQQRGAGIPALERIPYFREAALDKLGRFRHVLLVGSRPPISFFASPGEASELWARGTELLALPEEASPVGHLAALAEALGANGEPVPLPVAVPMFRQVRSMRAPSGPWSTGCCLRAASFLTKLA